MHTDNYKTIKQRGRDSSWPLAAELFKKLLFDLQGSPFCHVTTEHEGREGCVGVFRDPGGPLEFLF